jgi:hypothetical protein
MVADIDTQKLLKFERGKTVRKNQKGFAPFRLEKATLAEPAWMDATPIFPAPLCLKFPNLAPKDSFSKNSLKAATEHQERITQKKQSKSKLF